MALGQFSPGPDMILSDARFIERKGRRAGWLVVLGIVSGLCVHAALAIAGSVRVAMAHEDGMGEWGMGVLAAGYSPLAGLENGASRFCETQCGWIRRRWKEAAEFSGGSKKYLSAGSVL